MFPQPLTDQHKQAMTAAVSAQLKLCGRYDNVFFSKVMRQRSALTTVSFMQRDNHVIVNFTKGDNADTFVVARLTISAEVIVDNDSACIVYHTVNGIQGFQLKGKYYFGTEIQHIDLEGHAEEQAAAFNKAKALSDMRKRKVISKP